MATALLACRSLDAAVQLLQQARQHLDAGLIAFEVMAQGPLALVQRHEPVAGAILASMVDSAGVLPAWAVLIETTSPESDAHAAQSLHHLLVAAQERDWIQGAVVASQERQRQALWQLRESIPLAEKKEGLMVKHDIGLPTSAIPAFVQHMGPAIAGRWPDAQVVCFGHLGDGNLHYNVQPPAALAQAEALVSFEHAVNQLVFDEVMRLGGTISAEHGIGALRAQDLARRQSPTARLLMHAIKNALDPDGLMNPGRVLG
jgi:FAD/FMN-containing dehydrogenase